MASTQDQTGDIHLSTAIGKEPEADNQQQQQAEQQRATELLVAEAIQDAEQATNDDAAAASDSTTTLGLYSFKLPDGATPTAEQTAAVAGYRGVGDNNGAAAAFTVQIDPGAIWEPLENDVISGRGALVNQHTGKFVLTSDAACCC